MFLFFYHLEVGALRFSNVNNIKRPKKDNAPFIKIMQLLVVKSLILKPKNLLISKKINKT
jgi:hypothetical protein